MYFIKEKVLTDKQFQSAEKQFPIKEWWDVEYHPKDIPRKEYKEGDVVAIFDADTVVLPVS